MEGTVGDGGDVVLVQVQVLQLPQLLQSTRWNLSDDQSQKTSFFLILLAPTGALTVKVVYYI